MHVGRDGMLEKSAVCMPCCMRELMKEAAALAGENA